MLPAPCWWSCRRLGSSRRRDPDRPQRWTGTGWRRPWTKGREVMTCPRRRCIEPFAAHHQRRPDEVHRMLVAREVSEVRRAMALLGRGESLVFDATWSVGRHRESAHRAANQTSREVIEPCCHAPVDVVERRVAHRGPHLGGEPLRDRAAARGTRRRAEGHATAVRSGSDRCPR
jgi:predicted kinase